MSGHFFFFFSSFFFLLYAFSPKGALGYEAALLMHLSRFIYAIMLEVRKNYRYMIARVLFTLSETKLNGISITPTL